MSDIGDLVRHPQRCTVDPAKPWEGDLGRQQFGENLTRLLTQARTPLVLSIEGRWGTGKSVFIERWTADAKARGAHVIVLNAWTTSAYDSPRMALFGEVTGVVRDALKSDCPDIERIEELTKGLESVSGLFSKLIASSFEVLSHGIINEDVQSGAKEVLATSKGNLRITPQVLDEQISAYQAHKECYDEFSRLLGQMANHLQGSSAMPLIFVVDELDRCRPDYALDMLECLRHLFAAQHVAFVLSIDADQVRNSIKTVYGRSIDADRYLQRIIDIRLTLPRPKARDLVVAAIRDSRLDEAIRSQWDDSVTSTLIDYAPRFVMAYDLDIRTTERVVAHLCTCVLVADSSIRVTNLFHLVALSSMYPETYRLIEVRRDIDAVMKCLTQVDPAAQIEGLDTYQHFLAYVYRHMLSAKDFDAKVAALKDAVQGAPQPNTPSAELVLLQQMQMVESPRSWGATGVLDRYIKLVNLNAPFSIR